MRYKLAVTFLFASLCVILYSVQARETAQNREQITQGKNLGKKSFGSYCASCHGIDGSGNGPVASSLKQPPPDLRRIQARLGKFPADEVRKRISGTLTLPVHGRRDMPVWGMILSRTDINNLVAYLESIQRPFDPTPAD